MDVHPPLMQVQCAVRGASPAVASLAHVVCCISDLLDVSAAISLPVAAASGSVRLLDRVAAHLLNSAVRTSVSVKEHLFARAMEAALKNNDLPMVQKIHSLHEEPLVVASLGLAMEFGSLEMVQYVVTHRNDQSWCAPGIQSLCAYHVSQALTHLGPQDPLRVVQWLTESSGLSVATLWGGAMPSLFLAKAVRSVELLRWLVENDHLKSQDFHRALLVAMVEPGVPLDSLRCLVELNLTSEPSANAELLHGRQALLAAIANPTVVNEAAFISSLCIASLRRGNEATVEYVLSTQLAASLRGKVAYAARRPGGEKVLQWTQEAMEAVDRNPGRAIHDLALALRASYFCHVETIRWLYEERGQLQLLVAFDPSVKEHDLLSLFMWIAEARVDRNRVPRGMFNLLVGRGFLDAATFVQAEGIDGVGTSSMDGAAGHGHLHAVQWLHEQGYEGSTTSAMAWAAAGGHVHVLQWLHENRGDGCVACALRGLLRRPREFLDDKLAWDSLPVLNSLQWLRERQATSLLCRRDCLPETGPAWAAAHLTHLAARAGDMKLLLFIDEHFREEFALTRANRNQISQTTGRGKCHSAAVTWLCENHLESFARAP